MTKDEYIKNNQPIYMNNEIYSDPKYQCECGGNMRKRLNMVLASYPPKFRYECDKCGKVDFLDF